MARKNKENVGPPGAAVFGSSKAPVPKPKGRRAQWNQTTLGIMLDTLAMQKQAGNQTDNASWKPDAYTACEIALAGTEAGLNGSGGPPKTAKMCQTRWGAEKADYLVVKSLREKSGFGWDDERHLIIVEDDIFEELLKTCPNAAKWRTKPYPFYDEMADLVDGAIATGTNSFVPSGPTPAIDSDSDKDEDDMIDPVLRGAGGVVHAASREESIPWELSDDEVTPTSSRKRVRALSDASPTTSGILSLLPSTGHAMMAVSDSLKEVAVALARDPGGPSSPQRKTLAITAVMKMILPNEYKVRALQLIRSDTSIADVLLAIPEDDPMREAFLLAEIQGNSK
ncbi:hypothetical protein GGX14DRAFT_677828 [Mycena pura]|uniref:Myb/SANT-like domain-containing protein n=1 Tax=Mycena pura TaxID=153505 RepID=A0AAD6UV07_9AGAR|nr:hypothetical protein GGX14DRAFT_677828 [Mycena pura]